jgi:glycerol kinase
LSGAGAEWLALDQGGHASRALVFDDSGCKLDQVVVPIATQRPAADQVEHDAEELVASLGACIREATARHPGIVAAGLATQRSSMVCWERATGRALSPVLSWQDRRHATWLEQFAPRNAWIRAHTGLVLTPHYGASKMRWCLDHLPAVQAAADAGTLVMGPLASFLAYRLCTGRPLVADPANASRTQLWNPATGDWSPELLALFGVPQEVLPRCVTSRHDYGALEAAARPVPLVVVTGDQSAVPFASGPLDATAAYVNVGTGAFIQRAVRGHLPDAPRLLASVVWSDASGVDYMLEGTVNGGGAALDWFAAGEGVALEAALQELAAAPAPADPPLFLNTVAGLGSPYWSGALAPRFIGAGDRPARLRAVLESIAFLLAVNLGELQALGDPLQRLVLTGGLAANPVFVHALAAVTQLPLWASGEAEATARGLARLVAVPVTPWVPGPGRAIAAAEDRALRDRYARWRATLAHELASA